MTGAVDRADAASHAGRRRRVADARTIPGRVAVAWAGALLIVHLAFQDAWVPVSAAPSIPVLLFALAVSLLTALLFGMVPAWITSRADPMEAMRGSTRSVSEATGAQKTLVIA